MVVGSMRRFIALLILCCGFFAGISFAAEGPLPAEHHPWGRFPIGSWKTVRVVSQSYDITGARSGSSTTETKTTLVAADANSYTLKIEVTVDVQGKRFLSQAQTVKTGYCGEGAGQTLESEYVRATSLEVGDREIPCDLRKMTIEDSDTRRVTTVHYSNQEPPYVLRRESTVTRLQDGQTSSTVTEVVALGITESLLGEEHRATRFRTVSRHVGVVATTQELQCADIPGGVVEHESVERDASGKEVRRSTLTLVDYGLGKVAAEDAWKGRRRVWQRNRRNEKRAEKEGRDSRRQ